MSNIKVTAAPPFTIRSYDYDWERRKITVHEETTAVRAYKFRTTDDMELTMAKIVMLVSMQQSLTYQDKLAVEIESLHHTNELLYSANDIGEILAAALGGKAHVPADEVDSNTQVRYYGGTDTGLQNITIYDFLTKHLGIADLNNGRWDPYYCENVLEKLLLEIDNLNRVSETKSINIQSYVNLLTTSYTYGVNTEKLILNGCRNLAQNLN